MSTYGSAWKQIVAAPVPSDKLYKQIIADLIDEKPPIIMPEGDRLPITDCLKIGSLIKIEIEKNDEKVLLHLEPSDPSQSKYEITRRGFREFGSVEKIFPLDGSEKYTFTIPVNEFPIGCYRIRTINSRGNREDWFLGIHSIRSAHP
jgi:hypothetical protein